MRFLIPLLLTVLLAAPVSAQERHRQVWVTQSDSGDVVRGRMVELSGQTLALLTTDNRRIEVPLDRVLRIETRGDSLKNGAIIGAAIMGGLGLLGCQALSHGGQCATASILNAAMGAMIGVGVDALNAGRTAIYVKPSASAASSAPAARVQFRLKF